MTYPNDNDRRNLAYDNDNSSFGIVAAGAALLLALVIGVFMWSGTGEQQTASNERPMTAPGSTVTPPVTQPAPTTTPNAAPQNPALPAERPAGSNP